MKASNWLTHREARAAFGFTRTTLHKWAATGIPVLRGKMLPVRAGRATMVCSRTLKAAAAAMHSLAAVDRTRWRTTRELAEEFGLCPTAAYLWWRDGCPALGGKKIQMRRGLASHKNRRRLHLFDRNEVMKAVDATAKDQTQVANPQWASAVELKAEFGIHPVTLFKWARIGIPSLGVKLRMRRFATPVRCRGQKKRLAQLHQFDRTMVQRAARPQRPPGAMTVSEAAKQLGLSRARIRRAVAQKKLTAIRGSNDTYRTGRASLTYILPPQVNGSESPKNPGGLRANQRVVFSGPEPSVDVRDLSMRLASRGNESKNAVARRFFGGNEKKARSTLAQITQLVREGRIEFQ